jgi:hypothetical protein
VEEVTVDLDVLPYNQLFWFYHISPLCFVLTSLQKFAVPKSGVLSRWLIYLKTIVV